MQMNRMPFTPTAADRTATPAAPQALRDYARSRAEGVALPPRRRTAPSGLRPTSISSTRLEGFGGAAARRTLPLVERHSGGPVSQAMPSVSIHLPISNAEPALVRATLDALAALDYADFEVLVVDHNTASPDLWEPVAEHCARLGARFRFFCLGTFPGMRAGALNFALREAATETALVAVLTPGDIVAPDWLRRVTPSFAAPQLGFVQCPLDRADAEDTLFKQVIDQEKLDSCLLPEADATLQPGALILLRRVAVVQAGCWDAVFHGDEAELGLRMMRHGWEGLHLPQAMGQGQLPDDFVTCREERMLAGQAATQLLWRHGAAILSPFRRNLSRGQRLQVLAGCLPPLADGMALLAGLGMLAGSLRLLVDPIGRQQMLENWALPMAVVVLGLLVISGLAAAMRSDARGWHFRRGALLSGFAFRHAIGKGVLLAMLKGPSQPATAPHSAARSWSQALAETREETLLAGVLLATAAAVLAVGGAHGLVLVWAGVLVAQMVPLLASIMLSQISAASSQQDHPYDLLGEARHWQ